MIDVDPVDYIFDAFDQCMTHMLSMPTPMQTFIRTRLYRKMFLDFARHELASTQITTLDDLLRICTRCFARLGVG